MKQLWFTSSHFSPLPGEEEKTNPGRFGEALAIWVKDKLQGKGYAIDESPTPEDWGWVVMVYRKPFSLWVGCGNEDESKTRWGLFVEVEKSLLQKLFGSADATTSVAALENHLETLVREAGFEDIQWEQM
ncbi:hypothetical protein [Sedimenticola sp.]|uniref:hypothetical protein n=1 Tax=Sedimenticola sp. TaxID=1940285 RepID=UPI003D0C08ED